MIAHNTHLQIRLADSQADIRSAQRLRYRVFVQELHGDGPMVDHDAGLEVDRFDPYFDHLLLVDTRRDPANEDHVVGVYRMLTSAAEAAAGGFYSAGEFDLGPLKNSGRKLLELGRSCVDARYRGGTAMYQLWHGLGAYAMERDIEVLFGVASFHGIDPAPLAQPLSYLHQNHMAPPELRVDAIGEAALEMNILPASQVNRRDALAATPGLIKAYLRLGGFVGQGAFVDRAFNTTDICMILDIDRMDQRQRQIYSRGPTA